MGILKVEVVEIKDIQPHPNADRLEIALVKGWNCVVRKGEYKIGDKAIYFPIDSILPPKIECAIFGPNSKVKLHKSRVKTIKLRGAVSQGLLVDLPTLGIASDCVLGVDLTDRFGVKKYEPVVPNRNLTGGFKVRKHKNNEHFKKYTEIENIKNYPEIFQDSETVIITEKIHGTNFRCGWVPAVRRWDKFKSYIMGNKGYQFVFGSHNVQLQGQETQCKDFYEKNVYTKIVKQYDLKNKIGYNEIVYGEIYGDGIQKNYKYGCGPNEHKLVIFDLMWNGLYIGHDSLINYCKNKNLDIVPELYRGPFNVEKVRELTKGDSVLFPLQTIREGVVIKPIYEQRSYIGRKILKFVSDEYLLRKGNTDFH